MALQRSSFTPENNWQIDDFIEMADFAGSDLPKIQRYEALKTKKNLTPAEAKELEQLISPNGGGLYNKIMSVEEWNKRNQTTTNMQRYFKENTIDILTSYKNQMDNKVKEGISSIQTIVDRLSTKAIYDTSTTYEQCNLVAYDNGNTTDLYVCRRTCRNVLPSNTTYWTKLSIKGDKGENGLGISWGGAWTSNKEYHDGVFVMYRNGIYICIKTNYGIPPKYEGDNEYWQLMLLELKLPWGSVGMNELTDELKTIINEASCLTDRTTMNKYKLVIDNGRLFVEQIG